MLAAGWQRVYQLLHVADVDFVAVELDRTRDEPCDGGDVALGVAIGLAARASGGEGVEDDAGELSAYAWFAWH